MTHPDPLSVIAARRSVGRLGPPAPAGSDLDAILAAAVAAPDHELLRPWRFVVLEGEAKDAFGEVLAGAYLARCRAAGVEPTGGQLDKERTKLGRAPMVVMVGAVRREQEHKHVPFVEQICSAAAAAQNILLAATALGYGSMWRTGDAAYDPAVKAALGLGDQDALVGMLYLGTRLPTSVPPKERDVDLAALVERWSPPPGGLRTPL